MAAINFSGLASGIDSSSLIKSLMDQQRKARITPLEDKITSLTETNDAITELSSLLNTLKSKADKFRTINGSAISKLGTSSNENVLSATASNGASNGTYNVTVSSLSKTATFSFNDRFTTSSQAINSSIDDGAAAADRSVTVNIGSGSDQESVAVELTSTSTLTDFVTTFNASSTKAQASIVNMGTTGSPSYAVIINSANEGTAKGQISVSVGSQVTSAGTGAFAASSLSQATDSVFTVSGVTGTITRAGRNISDVIPGMSLSLSSTGTSQVSVADDSSTTATTVQEFVDAYNDVVKFIAENNTITQEEDSRGEKINVFGPLAGIRTDDGLLGTLRSSFSAATTPGGLIATLADLGVTTERDGTLKLDTNTLNTAIMTDSSSTRTILEKLGEGLASTTGAISQFTRYNGLLDISKNSNESQIKQLNDQISENEAFLARQEEGLIMQFSRLESLVGKLNSQQSALASLLPR